MSTGGPGKSRTAAGPTSSSSSGGGVSILDNNKSESSILVVTSGQSSSCPMDLAPRGPSVVQLRPVRPVVFSTSSLNTKQPSTSTGNVVNNSTTPTTGTPIISVNRSSPVTSARVGLTMATSVPGGPLGNTHQTYQITRVGVGSVNVRPPGPSQSQPHQPASITVTPLSSSNLGTNIRLTSPSPVVSTGGGTVTVSSVGGGPVNGGTSWTTTSGVGGGFSPAIRTTTITVGGMRPVRPGEVGGPGGGGVIHIPASSIVRPGEVDRRNMIHIPASSIVRPGEDRTGQNMIHIPAQNVTQLQVVDGKASILKCPTGTITTMNLRGTLPGGASGLPISPFTIRAANLASISSAIQQQHQRPPTLLPTSGTSLVPPSVAASTGTSVRHGGVGGPIQFVNKNVIQTISPLPLPLPKLGTVCLTLSTNATLTPNNSSPIVVGPRGGALVMTPSTLATQTTLPPASSTVTSAGTAIPLTKVYNVGRDGVPIPMDSLFPASSAVSVSISTSTTTSNNNALSLSQPPVSVVVAPGSGGQQGGQGQLFVHATPTINLHTQHKANLNSTAGNYFVDKSGSLQVISHPAQIKHMVETHTIDPKSLPPGAMLIPLIPSSAIRGPMPQPSVITPNHHHHHHPFPPSQQQQGQHILPPTITVTPSPLSIPAHVISQHTLGQASTSILTVTTTTITSTSSSASALASSSNNNNTTTSSSTSSSSATVVPVPASTASSSTTTTTTAPPAQSPGQNSSTTNSNNSNTTKATHSPRPSILRKREAGGGDHHVQVHHHGHASASSSSRAQRNLNLQLNFGGGNSSKESPLGIEKFGSSTTTTTASSSLTTTTTSSSSSSSGSAGGVSILKKEFQPPTEESSWQSVSSNSSSGSSTISTTSETAELQLQQQQQQQQQKAQGDVINLSTTESMPCSTTTSVSAFVGVGLSSALSTIMSSGKSSTNINSGSGLGSGTLTVGGLSISLSNPVPPPSSSSTTTSSSSAGASLLPVPPATTAASSTPSQPPLPNPNVTNAKSSSQPRSRSSSTSKKDRNKGGAGDKDKDKDKDEACSPRKKPRKQQLTSSDLLEAASPEIYYQGKGKRFRKDFAAGEGAVGGVGGIPPSSATTADLERRLLSDLASASAHHHQQQQQQQQHQHRPSKTVFHIKRKHMTLTQSNSIPPKPISTHFQRYTDVKPKEEKRPTVQELANQKGIVQRVNGWRVHRMCAQMEDLEVGESNVVNKCTSVLNRLEAKVGPNCTDRDLNIVMELLKGNIQRCKVIRDQIAESRAQALKIVEHTPAVQEVINKYSSKRSQAKKRTL